MQNPKFQMYKSTSNNQFYYRLRAVNGETILNGEGYASRQGCLSGIASVKANAPYDSRYEKKDSPTYTFVLKAANGEIIGRSESYGSSPARDNGIGAVKRDAPAAGIEDLT